MVSQINSPWPLEFYVDKYEITEWRNGSVFQTKFIETNWFDELTVNQNVPAETGVMYVAANDEFAQNNMTIRRKVINE